MNDVVIIAPDALVSYQDRTFRITHLLDPETVLAQDESTRDSKRLHTCDLTPYTPPPSSEDQTSVQREPDVELALVTDEDWKEAQRRFALIKPLLVAGSDRTREMVEEQARAGGVHLATLYRWIDAYTRTSRVSSLIPPPRNGGRGRSRLSKEAEAVVQATIEDFYLNRQKRSVQKTCEEVLRRCRNAKLPAPHPNTIRNRISILTDKVKLQRRQGSKIAREQYAHLRGNFPDADFPLSVVQIDHTLLDVMIVDDINRLSIGRPYLTIVIDVFSRMVCGFYVALDPPGDLPTGLAIAHAILPKEKWLARHDIATAWSVWGMPTTIHADNAKEFRGNMLKRACETHGIDLTWRPVGQPQYGGHIERLMGTVAKEIHALPGTTFSNVRMRGEYDSEAKAAMTLKEIEKYLATFFVEVYHQRVHDALKMSPVKKFEEGVFGTQERAGRGLAPRIMNEERLQLDFMPFVERTVQQYGVLIDDIYYFHDVLRPYIKAKDPTKPKSNRLFIFKRDPRDISQIYFFDPDLKEYRAIPYCDTSRPAISLWELREARQRLATEGRKGIDENLIFEAYERMREQEQQAIKETKSVRRKRSRREHHRATAKPLVAVEKPVASLEALQMEASAPFSLSNIKPFEEIEEL